MNVEIKRIFFNPGILSLDRQPRGTTREVFARLFDVLFHNSEIVIPSSLMFKIKRLHFAYRHPRDTTREA